MNQVMLQAESGDWVVIEEPGEYLGRAGRVRAPGEVELTGGGRVTVPHASLRLSHPVPDSFLIPWGRGEIRSRAEVEAYRTVTRRCDGCGRLVGNPPELYLDSPTGRGQVFVHRHRPCAEAARAARGGGKFRTDWPCKEDKVKEP